MHDVCRKRKLVPCRIHKGTLRGALIKSLKKQSGRKDLDFKEASAIAARTQHLVPIEERGGYPVKRLKGSVDPKNWVSCHGDKVEVDLGRAKWLPDEWGQGIKITHKNGRSEGKKDWGGRGLLTSFVAPDGKVFFHQHCAEQYAGKKFTAALGFNGQIRLARLQAAQAVQLARAQIKENKANPASFEMIGVDPDSSLFSLLSAHEKRYLPKKDELHFCVISARRATKMPGLSDIMMVQSQLQEAGAEPTWYVDEESVKDYRALSLKVVKGGKLTEARNKALRDARRSGKACVQISDDISAWEYRDGRNANERTDTAKNAAHAAARRIIVSPVAAARFILAKMRGADYPQPKLGGVYMLGSCARTFSGQAFSRHNFILGDFFVVDGGNVTFDEEMRLKEDYDFTCSHIRSYGSVMRCNRMTLNVKHYDNSGGACTTRDKKGREERRNIKILQNKWPGVFQLNPKRRNEVIMRWKKADNDAIDAEKSDRCSRGLMLGAKGKIAMHRTKMKPAHTTKKKIKGGDTPRVKRLAAAKIAHSIFETKVFKQFANASSLEICDYPHVLKSFYMFMQGRPCEKSSNSYMQTLKRLMMQQKKTIAAMANPNYLHLVKSSAENNRQNGIWSASVGQFQKFCALRESTEPPWEHKAF